MCVTKKKASGDLRRPEPVKERKSTSDTQQTKSPTPKFVVSLNDLPPFAEQQEAKMSKEKPQTKRSHLKKWISPSKSKSKERSQHLLSRGTGASHGKDNFKEENSLTKSGYITQTEQLENAQVTGLMATFNIKAALVKPAPIIGVESDDNSCKDTVEDVFSDMEDMIFEPLMFPRPKEVKRPFTIYDDDQVR